MKLPRKISLKTAIIAILLSVLLTTSIVYVLASPNGIFTISPGIFPGAPSYTIWKEGSYYYAKDAYGKIAYFGLDIGIVGQNVFDALTNGGTVFLAEGVYTFSSAQTIGVANIKVGWRIPSGVTLYGSGYGTVITQQNGLNQNYLITNKGHNPGGLSKFDERIQIKNLKLDGNYAGQTYPDDPQFAAAGLVMVTNNST